MRGVIQTPTPNTVMYTLPVGFRPPDMLRLVCEGNSLITITTAGVVQGYAVANALMGFSHQFSITA
jgi:hypothetical protein